MSETSFKIKCSASASARRFSLSKPTLAALRSHVEASWGASGPSFWYLDDDSDRIEVMTDRDLDAAVAAKLPACVVLNVDFTSITTLVASHAASASAVSSPRQSSDEAEHSFFIVESDSKASVEQDPKAMQQTVSSAPLEFPREAVEIVVDDQSSGDNASGFKTLQLEQQIRELKDEIRELKDGAARVRQAADEKFDAATSVLKKQLRQEADAKQQLQSQLKECHAMRSENENLRARVDEALSQAEQAKQQLKKAQEEAAAAQKQAAEAAAAKKAQEEAAAAQKKAAAAAQPAGLGRYAAPGKHVRHNGYIYAVAHAHDVGCRDFIRDGSTFVDIDAGFKVAPGDASDIEVANAHAWGSRWLVFSDGAVAATALRIAMDASYKGSRWNDENYLLRNGARVAADIDGYDVLLRRRA